MKAGGWVESLQTAVMRGAPEPAGTAKISLSPAYRGARPAVFEKEKEDWTLQSLMVSETWVESLQNCSKGRTLVLCVYW